jgi:hypothetical protein
LTVLFAAFNHECRYTSVVWSFSRFQCLSRSGTSIFPSSLNDTYVLVVGSDDFVLLIFSRKGGTKIERARDLFDQALEKCPSESCKPIFLMYAQLEEEHGLAKRAMQIYDRATQAISDEDRFEVLASLD